MSLKDLIGAKVSYEMNGNPYSGILVDVYLREQPQSNGTIKKERFAILRDDGHLLVADVGIFRNMRFPKDEYLKQVIQRLRYIKPADKEIITREELIDLEE